MQHTRIAALSLVATALATTGCGGSGSPKKTTVKSTTSAYAQTVAPNSRNPSTPPLTRTALIAKADAICRHLNKMNASIKVVKPADYKRSFLVMADYERTAVTSLNKLVPPAPMASDWNKILTNAQLVAEDTAKIGRYVMSGDTKAARSLLSSGQPILEEMRAIARSNGFKACALAA